MEKNLSYGEISDFYKEFEQFMEFLSKFMPFFVQICVEKNLAQKCVCGEKMTNIRYASNVTSLYYCSLRVFSMGGKKVDRYMAIWDAQVGKITHVGRLVM